MPYSITTKDGITIRNIPDEIDPNSDQLKRRVFEERAARDGASQQSGVDNFGTIGSNNINDNSDELAGLLPIDSSFVPPSRRKEFEALPREKQEAVVAQRKKPQAISGGDNVKSLSTAEGEIKQDFISTTNLTESNASELPEIGLSPELNEFSLNAVKNSLAANLITNEYELAKALQTNIPGSEAKKDKDGNAILLMPSGQEFAINKPGLSGIDFAQFAMRALSFLPTGKFVGMGAKSLGKLAAGTAATEATLQGVEASVGGEFNADQVLLAGALAPVGQVVSEKVLSPVARFAGGKISSYAKAIIEEGKKRGVKVLTSDLAPPESFLGKSLQQLSEKLGPLGSGSLRANQQRARVEIVEELAEEFGASLDNTVETSTIVKNLQSGVAKRLEQASLVRGEAVTALKKGGVVDVGDTIGVIDDQIASVQRLKGQADQGLLAKLRSLKDDYKGADFELLKDFRTSLDTEIREIQKGNFLTEKASVPLVAVRKSLNNTMNKFAKETDPVAASKWLQSNRMFADGLQKAKDTELKRILKDGTVSPEKLGRILKGGNLSEMRRINGFLDDAGRSAARNAIVRDALEESGFFTGNVNPDRFTTALGKGGRQRAVNTFFSETDKKQIEGIRKLLDATRRAQQTKAGTTTGLAEGSAILAPTAIGGLVGANPLLLGLFGTSMVASAKAYESKAVRNILLRLASAPKGSKAEREVLNKIVPGVLGVIQSARSAQQGQE